MQMRTRTIELGVHGIVLELFDGDGLSTSGNISSCLTANVSDLPPEWGVAMDVVESMVLGHACAGVDVQDCAYLEGLETAIEAIMNQN